METSHSRENAAEDVLVPVGEAAKKLGVSVRTLHRWEDEGRIAPASRTLAGHRRYSLEEINRVNRGGVEDA